jgi:hypothetical protein
MPGPPAGAESDRDSPLSPGVGLDSGDQDHKPERRARGQDGPSALAVALEVARLPRLRHGLRRRPVPRGTWLLFEIAADKSEVVALAVGATGKDPRFLKAAAIFYIDEVLWGRDADPYRILGANRGAALEVVRRNFDVLVDWLSSPDQRNRGDDLGRISSAWQVISDSIRLPAR